MLYGRTPFRGKNRQKTFTNVLQRDLIFPTSIPVSILVRQLMRDLLQRNPNKRLGSRNGANDVKNHPFFSGINWSLLRHMKPPPLETPVVLIAPQAESVKAGEGLNWEEEVSVPASTFHEFWTLLSTLCCYLRGYRICKRLQRGSCAQVNTSGSWVREIVEHRFFASLICRETMTKNGAFSVVCDCFIQGDFTDQEWESAEFHRGGSYNVRWGFNFSFLKIENWHWTTCSQVA